MAKDNNTSKSNLLDIDKKNTIVVDYFMKNYVKSYTESYYLISEKEYKEIAGLYSYTDSFDTMFAGYEKENGSYRILPLGCVGLNYLKHDVSFTDIGDAISLVDNISIVNSDTGSVEKS